MTNSVQIMPTEHIAAEKAEAISRYSISETQQEDSPELRHCAAAETGLT